MVVMSLWRNTVHIIDTRESLGYLFFKRQQLSDRRADLASWGGNGNHPFPPARALSTCTCAAILPLRFAQQGRDETGHSHSLAAREQSCLGYRW